MRATYQRLVWSPAAPSICIILKVLIGYLHKGGGLQVCWGGGGCRQSKKACVQWAAPTYDIYISLHITLIFHRLSGVPVRQNKRGDGRIEIT